MPKKAKKQDPQQLLYSNQPFDPSLEGNSLQVQKIKNYSSWTNEQNLLYITYLKEHIDQFSSKQNRKKHKVYHSIAKMMKTRTTDQVKSHNQKMILRYQTIPNIIAYLELTIQRRNNKNRKKIARKRSPGDKQFINGSFDLKVEHHQLQTFQTDVFETKESELKVEYFDIQNQSSWFSDPQFRSL